MSSEKWRQFCVGLTVLKQCTITQGRQFPITSRSDYFVSAIINKTVDIQLPAHMSRPFWVQDNDFFMLYISIWEIICQWTTRMNKTYFQYSDVPWISWSDRSPASRLFVQRLDLTNNKDNTKYMHCCPFVGGIFRWPQKGPVKSCPYHGGIMAPGWPPTTTITLHVPPHFWWSITVTS